MKLLLAQDGSVNSALALEAVLNHPWPEGTNFRVVTIAEPQNLQLDSLFMGGLGDMAKRAQKVLEDDLVNSLNEAVAKLKEKYGANFVSGQFLTGNPKNLIIEEAKAQNVDLIIMGARGASASTGDTWLGGVARAVTMNAPSSVQVLQPESTLSIEKKQQANIDIKDSRYLVAINDEHTSDALINSILSRPWPDHAKFEIITVIPSLEQMNRKQLFKNSDFQEYVTKMHSSEKTKAESLVIAAKDRLHAKFKDDAVTAKVLEGSARSVILQVAQDWPADMIIIGSHQHDANVMEKIFGSTAAAVMWNASCSVEIVKLSRTAVSSTR